MLMCGQATQLLQGMIELLVFRAFVGEAGGFPEEH
jgi:hypothetical protein